MCAPPSPGWEATPSQGYLPASNLWLPICTLGWRKPVHIPMGRLAGVKRLSQEHSNSTSTRTGPFTPSLEH